MFLVLSSRFTVFCYKYYLRQKTYPTHRMVRKTYNPGRIRQQLVFEKIKPKYLESLRAFRTYNKDLKEFLIDEAMRSQKLAISNTLLVFDRIDHIRFRRKKTSALNILGYVTIMNDSIRLDSSLRQAFKEKGVLYKSLPALKIGRLCVDDRFQRPI